MVSTFPWCFLTDFVALAAISAVDVPWQATDLMRTAPDSVRAATAEPSAALPPKPPPALPGVKELVSLRIDRDVLDFFQEDGPGWQDRINAALRKAAGK